MSSRVRWKLAGSVAHSCRTTEGMPVCLSVSSLTPVRISIEAFSWMTSPRKGLRERRGTVSEGLGGRPWFLRGAAGWRHTAHILFVIDVFLSGDSAPGHVGLVHMRFRHSRNLLLIKITIKVVDIHRAQILFEAFLKSILRGLIHLLITAVLGGKYFISIFQTRNPWYREVRSLPQDLTANEWWTH